MGFELPIRFRCDGCGIIIELPRTVTGLAFPVVLHSPALGGQISTPPTGWWQRGDALFCPAHKDQRIELATPGTVVALDAMRRGRKMN